MIILGIHGGVTLNQHEASACVVVNGRIKAATEEERYTRNKSSYGLLPFFSIKACLEKSNIKFSDVDLVVSTGITYKNQKERLNFFLKHNFGSEKKIYLIHHQDAHIASSFYSSKFKKALAFSLDASGDGNCGHVSLCDEDEIKKVSEMKNDNSLGFFYTLMTHYLGFNDGDEYKVMGLAPYGKPNIDLNKILKITKSGWKLNKSFIRNVPKIKSPFEPMYSNKLITLLGKPRTPGTKINRFHENLAASVQQQFENAFLSYCIFLKKKYPDYKNLCLSGGAVLNCSANGKLLQTGLFEDIYIPPMPSDRGLSVGCAYLGSKKFNIKKISNQNPYLGESYSRKKIIRELKSNGINFIQPKNLSKFCAEHIHKNKIIGLFQGRSEIGARALGNRSIISNARSIRMRDTVNEKIKFREKFRPFAPVILNEYTNEYFENYDKKFPYMSTVLKATQKAKKTIPAVIHIDGSARVQTVDKKSNKILYDLINSYYKLSGIPVLLNTSFNLKGEPIVETPRDAIKTFFGCGIDLLVLGSIVIMKDSLK